MLARESYIPHRVTPPLAAGVTVRDPADSRAAPTDPQGVCRDFMRCSHGQGHDFPALFFHPQEECDAVIVCYSSDRFLVRGTSQRSECRGGCAPGHGSFKGQSSGLDPNCPRDCDAAGRVPNRGMGSLAVKSVVLHATRSTAGGAVRRPLLPPVLKRANRQRRPRRLRPRVSQASRR